jgi:hypothetical protein
MLTKHGVDRSMGIFSKIMALLSQPHLAKKQSNPRSKVAGLQENSVFPTQTGFSPTGQNCGILQNSGLSLSNVEACIT